MDLGSVPAGVEFEPVVIACATKSINYQETGSSAPKHNTDPSSGHASASYRLYVHLVWPTKYRKHILGEKLTPVVEDKIGEVCSTRGYNLIIVQAVVDQSSRPARVQTSPPC